jgi:hypothetical protein
MNWRKIKWWKEINKATKQRMKGRGKEERKI